MAGYFGPTDPLPQVVTDVNANADRIPTMRGAGSFEAWIKDGKNEDFVNGQVTLLYSGPREFRMIGKKDVAGSVFEIGSNDERYWLIVRGKTDTMWAGTHAKLGQIDASQLPVRPDLVLQVLGIQPIPTQFLEQPAPVMRFNNDADAYMLLWNVTLDDRWIAQKEIWYDRQTKLPKLVVLFGENGRIVLRAYLSKHEPVEAAGLPREQWPNMATSYRLLFPETGSRMNIDLNEDLALTRNKAPNARSFIFPGENAGVSHVIDIDTPPNDQ